MDPRKIQFLIAMQREIDKVEAREGETSTRVERLKSRFYDVVEVAEMVGKGEGKTVDDQVRPKSAENSSGLGITSLFFESGSPATDATRSSTETPNLKKEPETFPFHRPIIAKECLKNFSINEVYKQFTHPNETGPFNYELLTEEASKNWNDYFKRHYEDLHLYTYYRLRDFVFTPVFTEEEKKYYEGNEYGFRTYGHIIPIGWGAEEVRQWCTTEKNKYRYPSQMPIPVEKRKPAKHNRRIQYVTFGQVIQRFKYDIEQRTDDHSQTFDLLLRESLSRVDLNRDLQITMNDMDFKLVSFYADLVQIKNGLDKIFKLILDNKSQSNQVSISVEKFREKYEVAIIHQGGYLNKDVDDPKNTDFGGDRYDIRKLLKSVCDWQTIYATKDKKSHRFDYLTDGCNINLEVFRKEVEYRNEVRHLLTFYR